jgi:hypothetical protein
MKCLKALLYNGYKMCKLRVIGLWISLEKSMVKSAYLRLWGVLEFEIPPTPLKKGGQAKRDCSRGQW